MRLNAEMAVAWDPTIGIPTIILGVIVLILVWLFGTPKREQGKRRVIPEPNVERREPTFGADSSNDADSFDSNFDHRTEPTLSGAEPQQGELDVGLRMELERLGATLADERHATVADAKTHWTCGIDCRRTSRAIHTGNNRQVFFI